MWVNWEIEMPGMKALEPPKVWEDICRAFHPFGQPDFEYRERAEDMEAVWLHKEVESIGVMKIHIRELWCGSRCDCNHEWFTEADKVTALAKVEMLEVFQRWHNLKCLAFPGSWECRNP